MQSSLDACYMLVTLFSPPAICLFVFCAEYVVHFGVYLHCKQETVFQQAWEGQSWTSNSFLGVASLSWTRVQGTERGPVSHEPLVTPFFHLYNYFIH